MLLVPRPSIRPPRASAANNHDGGNERYVIPNLRNACRILKSLEQHPDGLKAADLARTLQIPVTTTLRIMTTLHREGFARKVEGRYELGPVLIQLGHAALAGTEIREQALPVLRELTESTDETSHVAIPCDERALIVAVQDSAHPLRAASQPGFLAELHCSATGKIFLTYLHHGDIARVVAETKPARRTPKTLIAAAALKREIELTAKRGYSLDDEEFNEGVRCLAAPVFGADGHVAAAIGITASAMRFTKDRIPEMAAKVKAAAAELSRLIGSPHARKTDASERRPYR